MTKSRSFQSLYYCKGLRDNNFKRNLKVEITYAKLFT